MGADNLRIKLPHLITWACDLMHGNTMKDPCGRRTRVFDAIKCELRAFFDVHDREGSHPRGIHLEMTGRKVTECVSGSQAITLDDLGSRYRTHCE
ncbi:hypothetical protein OPV22_001781 [Ensete ventricosum]|uniref:Phospho-2-dehydro-3-deoxyheptonate aldolase n=1 Tax=Ensete ventricosum TaxID=4639 RepID=A0AAV8RQV3_ENSVE|nr:hypothetical protein OPV22_001781 [Ensete ventricosum]